MARTSFETDTLKVDPAIEKIIDVEQKVAGYAEQQNESIAPGKIALIIIGTLALIGLSVYAYKTFKK